MKLPPPPPIPIPIASPMFGVIIPPPIPPPRFILPMLVFEFPRNVVPPRPAVVVGLAWRVSRGGGSNNVKIVVNLVNQERCLPLGRVRNGFPVAELVSVAVARLFWNSLAKFYFCELDTMSTSILTHLLSNQCLIAAAAWASWHSRYAILNRTKSTTKISALRTNPPFALPIDFMLGERDIPMVNINTQVQRNLAQIF